jgi:hypothetical protein
MTTIQSCRRTLIAYRVTRLGEFSPIGWLFTLVVLINPSSRPKFWTTFVMYKFWQKMGLATAWAIFSQTHLVTLISYRLCNHHRASKSIFNSGAHSDHTVMYVHVYVWRHVSDICGEYKSFFWTGNLKDKDKRFSTGSHQWEQGCQMVCVLSYQNSQFLGPLNGKRWYILFRSLRPCLIFYNHLL